MQHAEGRVQYNSPDRSRNTPSRPENSAAPRTNRSCPSLVESESLVFQTTSITAGARHLNVAIGPDNGPPLLLLHGVTRGWHDWSNLFAHLSPRWRIVAIDFRGHGASEPAPGRYRVADYVDDALAALHQCVGESTVVMGHSLGAMVALAAAAQAPELVRAVVAEDPPFHTMGERIASTPLLGYFRDLRRLHSRGEALFQFTNALANVPVAISRDDGGKAARLGDVRDMASLRMAAAMLKRVDPEVFEPIVAGRWLDGYDVKGVLAGVRCPLLLLQADTEAGGMLTDDDAALAEQTAKECFRVRFPGVGHLIHWTDPAGMLRPVLAFLESLRIDDTFGAAARRDADVPAGETYRIDGHETRLRHGTHQERPVG